MRILVVDDEPSFGSLLGRTLKRLGHRPVITVHPHDALEVLAHQSVDAVITDIDMPMMNGVELAQAIRDQDPNVPIAFCTGSNLDDHTADAARQIGRVLPKVWTVADVKDIVSGLQLARPRLARGSQTELPPLDHRTSTLGRKQPKAKRTVIRKIKVTCRTWDQVDKLVEQQAQGRSMLTLRGSHRLKPSERLTVALSLPDELVLSIPAEVAEIRRDESGSGVFVIALTGLTSVVCVRLRSMSQAAGSSRPRASYHKITRAKSPEVVAEDTDVGSAGTVLGNLRLRKQIETLPTKMRPSSRGMKN